MALIPSPPSSALLQQNSHKNQGRESRDIHFKMSYDLHKKYDIFPHSRFSPRGLAGDESRDCSTGRWLVRGAAGAEEFSPGGEGQADQMQTWGINHLYRRRNLAAIRLIKKVPPAPLPLLENITAVNFFRFSPNPTKNGCHCWAVERNYFFKYCNILYNYPLNYIFHRIMQEHFILNRYSILGLSCYIFHHSCPRTQNFNLIDSSQLNAFRIVHTATKIPEKELRSLSPNFHIHVSVSDLQIPRIGHILSCSRIGRPIVGM
jgi:hypothetical protein